MVLLLVGQLHVVAKRRRSTIGSEQEGLVVAIVMFKVKMLKLEKQADGAMILKNLADNRAGFRTLLRRQIVRALMSHVRINVRPDLGRWAYGQTARLSNPELAAGICVVG